MSNELVAYSCQIVEADFETNIIKIEMLDKTYKASTGMKFLCDEYTHPAKTLTDEDLHKLIKKAEKEGFGEMYITGLIDCFDEVRAILRKAQEK